MAESNTPQNKKEADNLEPITPSPDDLTNNTAPATDVDEKPKENDWAANAEAARKMEKQSSGKFARLKDFSRAYWQRKKWTIPVTLLVVLVALLAVPFSRYAVLGLFIKHQVTISIKDSVTGRPVSSAVITNGSQRLETDGNGHIKTRLSAGPHTFSISKKYYKASSNVVNVKLFGDQAPADLTLIATGRQVPISVTNKVTGKGLANVSISILGTKAKTDKTGKTTLVLPANAARQKAVLEFGGYNKAEVAVTITDQMVSANNFSLTPAGKLYFLSNRSGKIDVVKTNLDGSARTTVLAGSGTEDSANTALLASRDWKYLALLSKRSGQSGIYLINTATDDITNIEGGSATTSFTLVGWSGDTFVYQTNRSNVQSWQPGASTLKSYDAAAGKLFSLDQTQGEGSSQNDYALTSFGAVSIVGNELVYTKSWYASASHSLDGKSASLAGVRRDGSNRRSIKDFPVPAGTTYAYIISSQLYEPRGVYVQVPGNNGGTSTYYEYEAGKISQKNISDDTYNKPYPTYLLSPSDKLTFWSDVRDNKNTLFVGDNDAQQAKEIASLSSLTPYGWYSDNYLLASKDGSELYILPATGGKSLKVTDYYKPQLSFRGYGGGYGGL